MTTRVEINYRELIKFLREPSRGPVLDAAQRIDSATQSESRVDSDIGPERIRAAVIAGYERGATAESTRTALLRALDGA